MAKEMSVWKDIRIIPELEPAYIPDKIDYGSATYTSVNDVLCESAGNQLPTRIKVCGIDAMSVETYNVIKAVTRDQSIENGDSEIYRMRLIKSRAEIAMLKKAWQICDIGYEAILDADIVGLTEIQAAAIGEKAARDAGAEHIVFSIFCSGNRTNTAVGRPTQVIIQKGDMIMSSLAIQYEGYIATNAWPFVAGNKPTDSQRKMMASIIEAEQAGLDVLEPGVSAGVVVKAVKNYFKKKNLEAHDIYPPVHGIGLAEAESPYPDAGSNYSLDVGMGVNFDVNLFDVPHLGSNRIEEGFIIAEDGVITLSKMISSRRERYLDLS